MSEFWAGVDAVFERNMSGVSGQTRGVTVLELRFSSCMAGLWLLMSIQ